mgnify:CR=1 FL=1|tara:strand:+ start:598 stop:1461 length:864 start_codon:yes stop_codon:yes gene_type:complete
MSVRVSVRVRKEKKRRMFAVNLHILRGCNFACDYCFHSNPALRSNADRPFLPPLVADDYDVAIDLLAQEGCTKINVAGGEPFLVPELVSSILKQSKKHGIFTSVITNGAFATIGANLDMFGVSIDSFDRSTNAKIGRGDVAFRTLLELRQRAKAHDVKFKINTVVSQKNLFEDFNAHIGLLDVDRWKVFQVLEVPNENGGHFGAFGISDAEFEDFLARHAQQDALVAETNAVMQTSYLILDEHLRFLDGTTKQPLTESLLVDNSAISTALKTLDPRALRARRGDFYL